MYYKHLQHYRTFFLARMLTNPKMHFNIPYLGPLLLHSTKNSKVHHEWNSQDAGELNMLLVNEIIFLQADGYWKLEAVCSVDGRTNATYSIHHSKLWRVSLAREQNLHSPNSILWHVRRHCCFLLFISGLTAVKNRIKSMLPTRKAQNNKWHQTKQEKSWKLWTLARRNLYFVSSVLAYLLQWTSYSHLTSNSSNTNKTKDMGTKRKKNTMNEMHASFESISQTEYFWDNNPDPMGRKAEVF